MFYDPRSGVQPAPLTQNPVNALVAPRPIGWIGTISRSGQDNLAPFSYFNLFSSDPPTVGFAPNEKANGGSKDSLTNVREVPEFTVSIVSESLAQVMNATSSSLPHGASEFAASGIPAANARSVKPRYVAAAAAVLECRVFDIVTLPARVGGRQSHLVIGEVVGIHIDDALIVDGKVDTLRLAPLSRLGYFDYGVVRELIHLPRPD